MTTVSKLTAPEEIVEFELAGQRYCVGIDSVEEIVRAGELTPLPNAASEVAGMMTLREQTTTVLEPAQLFDIDPTQSATQVIIFDGEDGIGWLVDRVNRVSTRHSREAESAPDSPYVSGLIRDDEELLIWVDPVAVNESVV